MKKCTIKFSILLAISVGLINSACSNDEWDKHYNNTDVVIINQSLSEIIKNESDLTIFSRLMKISGYDTILSSSQTFTVWAPLDTDSAWYADYSTYLNESIVADTVKISKLIGNHISRFSYPTSGLDSQRLFMLCNKPAEFIWRNNKAYFGNIELGLDANIPAKNGLLHKISGYNHYIPGHWEFLFEYPETANLDSLKSYFNSLIVTDEYGKEVNTLFRDYAKLDNDDSTYTFLALTNDAWRKALTQALSYHKLYKDSRNLQYQYSKSALLSTLFYNNLTDPIGLDSIISTSKTVIKNVNNMFAGATKYSLSNGSMFVTDSFRLKPIESYHKRIVVEAETNIYGRLNTSSDLYNRSYTGTNYSISNKSYALLKFTGSNTDKTTLTMSIPNVLSGKYKLYVVTVPYAIEGTNLAKGVKFKVKVARRDELGYALIVSDMNYFGTGGADDGNDPVKVYTASGSIVDKVYIAELNFPFCSMYEKGNPKSLEVKVYIENTVTRTEDISPTNKWTRDLRIDCVILEPVE